MEYNIELRIAPADKYKKSIDAFIDNVVKGDIGNASNNLKNIDEIALDKFNNILNSFYTSDYIQYMENLEVKKSDGIIYFDEITTGGRGYEFSVALIDLLGPYCKKVTADVTHDEEDGHIPETMIYQDDSVYVDGSQTAVRIFEDEDDEDDPELWKTEPVLSEKALSSIHAIAKKSSKETTIAGLAKILLELYDPIVSIATKEKVSMELLGLFDKRGHALNIENLSSLDIYKNNHPFFSFLKDKILENLIQISETEYFGSVVYEYAKTLLVFFEIYEVYLQHKEEEEIEETTEAFFDELNEQVEFDVIYEGTELIEFFDIYICSTCKKTFDYRFERSTEDLKCPNCKVEVIDIEEYYGEG